MEIEERHIDGQMEAFEEKVAGNPPHRPLVLDDLTLARCPQSIDWIQNLALIEKSSM